MADPRINPKIAAGSNMFKEAVCINTDRIYDSVTDKDCIENLRVYFTNIAQNVIDHATSVKCTEVKIINVYMDVEPIPFNKGFYSVDMTFYFAVTVNAVTNPSCQPTTVTGAATFQKKVILYGSEGNVKTFRSDNNQDCLCPDNVVTPKAALQAVDPICLSTQLLDCCCNCNDSCDLPPCLCRYFDGDFSGVHACKRVFVTLGLFTIVLMERASQIMIPAYDFCIPDKESSVNGNSTEDPCSLFQKIKFPTDEFFPPKLST